MGSLASNGEGERSSSKRKNLRSKMCVRYTLLIANSLLALLGLLLLAGGVWRIVDDESLRDVAKEIQDTQEWNDVKGEVTGLEDAVKEASTHKYFNYALLKWAESPSLLLSLDIVEPKRRISASSLSTASASSSSSFSRSPPSSSSTLMTPTLISSRSPSAHRLTRLILILRSCNLGPSLSRTYSLECPLASPPSSSSSPSPSAVGRGGRRGFKDMLMPSRLNKTLLHISTVLRKYISTMMIS